MATEAGPGTFGQSPQSGGLLSPHGMIGAEAALPLSPGSPFGAPGSGGKDDADGGGADQRSGPPKQHRRSRRGSVDVATSLFDDSTAPDAAAVEGAGGVSPARRARRRSVSLVGGDGDLAVLLKHTRAVGAAVVGVTTLHQAVVDRRRSSTAAAAAVATSPGAADAKTQAASESAPAAPLPASEGPMSPAIADGPTKGIMGLTPGVRGSGLGTAERPHGSSAIARDRTQRVLSADRLRRMRARVRNVGALQLMRKRGRAKRNWGKARQAAMLSAGASEESLNFDVEGAGGAGSALHRGRVKGGLRGRLLAPWRSGVAVREAKDILRAGIDQPVLDPESLAALLWRGLMFVTTMGVSMLVPWRAGFDPDVMYGKWTPGLSGLDVLMYLLDVILVADLFVQARMGYIEFGNKIMARDLARARYLKSFRFKMDLLSVLPLDFLGWAVGQGSGVFLWRLLRLIRCLHLPNLWESAFVLAGARGHGLVFLAKTLVYTLTAAHFVACAWFRLSVENGFGCPAKGSTALREAFVPHAGQSCATDQSFLARPELAHAPAGQQYLQAMLFSVTTLTGRVAVAPNPLDTKESWFNVIMTVVGIFLGSYIVGAVTVLVAELNSGWAKYRQRVLEINRFARHNGISMDVHRSMLDYYAQMYEECGDRDANTVLFDLPRVLRNEIALYLTHDTLLRVPMFKDAEEGFVLSLVHTMKAVNVQADEFVIRAGRENSTLYLVHWGQLDVEIGGRGDIRNAVAPAGSVETAEVRRARKLLASTPWARRLQAAHAAAMRNKAAQAEERPDTERQGLWKSFVQFIRQGSTPSHRRAGLEDGAVVVDHLNAGSHFGEGGLTTMDVKDRVARASVRAVTFSTLYALQHDTVRRVLARFPVTRDKIARSLVKKRRFQARLRSHKRGDGDGIADRLRVAALKVLSGEQAAELRTQEGGVAQHDSQRSQAAAEAVADEHPCATCSNACRRATRRGGGTTASEQSSRERTVRGMPADSVATEIARTKAQKKRMPWLLHPRSSFRTWWLVAMQVAVMYNLVAVPLRIAFDGGTTHAEDVVAYIAGDIVVDVMYVLDVLLQHRTAYYERGLLMTDLTRIAAHYREQSVFWRDILSSVPTVLAYVLIDKKASPWFRVNKLLRAFHVSTWLREWVLDPSATDYGLRYGASRLLELAYLLATCLHYVVCFYWGIFTTLEGYAGVPAAGLDPQSLWMPRDDEQSFLPPAFMRDATVVSKYSYAAWMCVLPVGLMRDREPVTTAASWFVILVTLLGTYLFAYAIGDLGAVITNTDHSAAAFRERKHAVEVFARKRHLPVALRRRVLDFFSVHWQSTHGIHIDDVCNYLPVSLAMRVRYDVYRTRVRRVRLFSDLEDDVVLRMCSVLSSALLPASQVVYRVGELGDELFMVARGAVDVYVGPDADDVARGSLDRPPVGAFRTLGPGSVFGEVAYFEEIRTETVRARTNVELLSMDFGELFEVLKSLPGLEARMRVLGKRHIDAAREWIAAETMRAAKTAASKSSVVGAHSSSKARWHASSSVTPAASSSGAPSFTVSGGKPSVIAAFADIGDRLAMERALVGDANAGDDARRRTALNLPVSPSGSATTSPSQGGNMSPSALQSRRDDTERKVAPTSGSSKIAHDTASARVAAAAEERATGREAAHGAPASGRTREDAPGTDADARESEAAKADEDEDEDEDEAEDTYLLDVDEEARQSAKNMAELDRQNAAVVAAALAEDAEDDEPAAARETAELTRTLTFHADDVGGADGGSASGKSARNTSGDLLAGSHLRLKEDASMPIPRGLPVEQDLAAARGGQWRPPKFASSGYLTQPSVLDLTRAEIAAAVEAPLRRVRGAPPASVSVPVTAEALTSPASYVPSAGIMDSADDVELLMRQMMADDVASRDRVPAMGRAPNLGIMGAMFSASDRHVAAALGPESLRGLRTKAALVPHLESEDEMAAAPAQAERVLVASRNSAASGST